MPKRTKPPYQPTPADRATVQNLAALGATHTDIAMCIGTKGIDEKTLRKHFRRELDTSLAEVKALAMSKVVAAIRNGEAWAICFFMKCRGGWRETQSLEHTGLAGGPIQIATKPDLSQLSDEELDQLHIITEKTRLAGRN